MGSSPSVPNKTSYVQGNYSTSSTGRSTSGGSLSTDLPSTSTASSSGCSTPAKLGEGKGKSPPRSVWSKLTPTPGRRTNAVTPLPPELRSTVKKVFNQLEFQNANLNTHDLDGMTKWHTAQKILSNNPQLMLSFITATKSMYLKESKQLVSISDELVNMDLKNSVSFPKETSGGVFDSLYSSKPDPNSIANRQTRKVKAREQVNEKSQQGKQSRADENGGFKTPSSSMSRTITVKRKKQSLAEMVRGQRDSITAGHSYDKRLTLSDQRKLAEIVKHAQLDNKTAQNLDKITIEEIEEDKRFIATNRDDIKFAAKTSATQGGDNSRLSNPLHAVAASPSQDDLYTDRSERTATPPIATAHPAQNSAHITGTADSGLRRTSSPVIPKEKSNTVICDKETSESSELNHSSSTATPGPDQDNRDNDVPGNNKSAGDLRNISDAEEQSQDVTSKSKTENKLPRGNQVNRSRQNTASRPMLKSAIKQRQSTKSPSTKSASTRSAVSTVSLRPKPRLTDTAKATQRSVSRSTNKSTMLKK